MRKEDIEKARPELIKALLNGDYLYSDFRDEYGIDEFSNEIKWVKTPGNVEEVVNNHKFYTGGEPHVESVWKLRLEDGEFYYRHLEWYSSWGDNQFVLREWVEPVEVTTVEYRSVGPTLDN